MASSISTKDDIGFSDRLRADLMAGKYRPGEWLKQIDLENTYGANRFEVRIALSELAARHLLEHLPNRGYRVANPTDREREELYEVRSILEMAAARKIVARATAEDVDAFAALVQRFDDAVENGGPVPLQEINFDLHDTFYRMCGNDMLAQQIRELRERGVPGRGGSWRTVTAVRTSSLDHREMLEMLRRRDPEGLAHVIYRHLYRWREYSQPVVR
ncbi:MAG TPA: GntR family transcriptional regulator [Azospirillaceae bacterium]|nr:GntR family transcriptional regulator [Azospirillaceae bacterium]